MALKDIKTKIQATKRMHTVTRAMEAVSAVKMRKSQQAAFASRPFAHSAISILARISGSGHFSTHTLMTAREVKRIALVVITSDKGLASSLNSAVLKEAGSVARNHSTDAVDVYTIGKKAGDFFQRRGYTLAMNVPNNTDDVSSTMTRDIADALVRAYSAGTIDQAIVVYSNLLSTFEQVATSRVLMPLSLESVKQLLKDITPVKGKWSNDVDVVCPVAYSVESSGQSVLDAIVPKLVSSSLYHMMIESKASEHSARMVAMKNARDKSQEVAKSLTRTYNKIRQAAITREVSEIVSGREALAT